MAPGNNGRHPNHTGTIPKTKVRNNCNVPQEAVTPTRRDMSTNLVSTSLDWVPVSEYNTRSNYSQSRKPSNNTSDHELTDIDNAVSFESGFGRFVPVRPQPRALPLNVQNRDISDNQDDGAGSSLSSHSLHPYQMQNGLNPHSNHAAAAVMIVNPTTPNAVAGNISQPFNAPNQNRNNLTRNLNPARNNFEGSNASNNNNSTPPVSNSRSGTKTVNLMNNMYDQGQGGSFNNINDNNLVHRESARALGEAMVATCPDAVAVERRLGQIREYIRVTSTLVDTMRNSEDEAFIEHTKEEYDELIQMIQQLKESETKLEDILSDRKPDNIEVPAEENDVTQSAIEITEVIETPNTNDKTNVKSNEASVINNNLKKVTNIENEQLNKSLNIKVEEEQEKSGEAASDIPTVVIESPDREVRVAESSTKENEELIEDENAKLYKNIQSCVEKVARIEEMKNAKESKLSDDQVSELVTRPVSVQSNGSAYSETELWQNEIKNKMEMSQMRLAALKQQQKRLLKYQEETKQQLEEINRERDRQSQENQPSTSHDNYSGIQNQGPSGYNQTSRMYAANQIGVATTLPHSSDMHADNNDERFSSEHGNIASGEEATGGMNSEEEGEELELSARGQLLQHKLRELHMKKQHMETLVAEFQKLQMATRIGHNTYSSSGEDSADEEPARKCNKSGGNIKNEDPFKLMEIKAIKTALQKTKDLMRSVENYETENLTAAHDDCFREMSNHSNIHDNKSEGGGSVGGWSNDGSVCRVRNSLPQRHKFTNEQHQMQLHDLQHQQQLQHHQQMQQHQQLQQQNHQQMQNHQMQNHQQIQNHQMQNHHQMVHQSQQTQSHEAKIASLQELAQELRMETEKIMNERARIKDVISNKEVSRKHKKVNEDVRPAPGPVERRQMQLRAILADKQRELELLLNKEKVLVAAQEAQSKPESQSASIINQSYNSEQEEPDSRSEQLLMDSQNSREIESFRASGDSGSGGSRAVAPLPEHVTSNYASDSDSVSRNKNQRNRPRRRQTQERLSEDNIAGPSNNSNQNPRHEPRPEMSTNVNMVPPIAQNLDSSANLPYPHLPPPCWSTKSNQDMRTNQFTQNSHSQTMERLLGTPQMSFPPSMPFNMMMPYGMVGGCGCGCGVWGAWCWQQLVMQQREIHALKDQLHHLEERWRAETASHTLNNQVPPGNRANNYWDNFRSYSRQNLLSASSKANAEGASAAPQPLAERSHNPLHRGAAPARKRNARDEPRNLCHERSLSLSSAPDVHLNPPDPIPETARSHSNLPDAKRKSSSKLPAKNSRRNCSLDYSQTSNVNIASSSEPPNPNLASTSGDARDKATSKLFDLLKENVYSEVTALIGVNETHPDFLIQLFRELRLVADDDLRRKVLQAIRRVLAPWGAPLEPLARADPVSTSGADADRRPEPDSASGPGAPPDHPDDDVVRFLILNADGCCTADFLETLATRILDGVTPGSGPPRRRLLERLARYEGAPVARVTSDLIENLPRLTSSADEIDDPPESTLQDVAGSLNLFRPDGAQQHDGCPYEAWPGREHDANDNDNSARSSQDGKVDLINCEEMQNGDLAEADQTCPDAADEPGSGADALPDVVDADEVTPTEAEAEWIGLDRVPTRLHMEQSSEKQKD